jgi:hypothetical protein
VRWSRIVLWFAFLRWTVMVNIFACAVGLHVSSRLVIIQSQKQREECAARIITVFSPALRIRPGGL